MVEDNKSPNTEEILSNSLNSALKVQSALKKGQGLSGIAKGIALGGPHSAAIATLIANKETALKIGIASVIFFSLPILFILMLPTVIFGNLFDNSDVLNNSSAVFANYYAAESVIREALNESYQSELEKVKNIAEESGKKFEIREANITFNANLLISQYCVHKGKDIKNLNINDLKNTVLKHKDNLYSYTTEIKVDTIKDKDGNENEVKTIIYKINYVGDDYFADNVFFLTDEERELANEFAQNLVLFFNNLSYQGSVGTSSVSEDVLKYENLLIKYAELYGIPQYIEVLKAIMMQESGGRLVDVMQSSECGYNTLYPKRPNGITDSEYSIDCGVHYFADALSSAGCTSPTDINKMSLALQGYNYGLGYITWAVNNYGGYSESNAIEFSNIMKAKTGWSRYGDTKYVEHVLRYYNPYSGGNGEWGNPFIGRDWTLAITSEFGYRKDPITGASGAFHQGLDIAYPKGTNINAVKDGKIIFAGDKNNGYGLNIIIDHGDGIKSQYAHCSQLLVSVGQTVSKGDIIALVGSTGRSTGPHLHLNIYVNDELKNPRNYITN